MRPLVAAYQGDEPYAFVCYAHADSADVYPEISWIATGLCHVWYDEGITGGTVWRDEIAKSILGASVLLFYMSPRSQASEECLKEVGFALDNNVPVLTIMLEAQEVAPGLKLSLHNRQSIERYRYDEGPYRAKLDESLRQILQGTLPSVTAAQPVVDTIGRYELQEPRWHETAVTTYAAWDRLKRRAVTIRRTESENPRQVDLAQEFKRLKQLSHPNLVTPLEFAIEEDGVETLVLDLPGDARTFSDTARAQSDAILLEFLCQGLRALHHLHLRGQKHGALSPEHLVVVDDRLKLIALASADTAERYQAPEVRAGEGPDARSDLYSFGLLAYDALSEEDEPLTTPPSGSLPRPGDGVPERLRDVFSGLLNESPRHRYQSAHEALVALQAVEEHLIAETPSTRESALQAAEFVGRTDEMDRLQRALEATQRSRGQTILIGGESGIGKTRLLAEIETVAMLRGVTVVRGSAVEGDTGRYKIWDDIVQHLAMLTASDMSGFNADDARLDESSFLALEALLHAQQNPVLVVMEDLHWAGTESLKLLNWLVRPVLSLPILILATYRPDEGFSPADVGEEVQVLQLGRLPNEQIAHLAGAILGYRPEPALQDFLVQQSEGNSLFVVETLRVLAEEAGGLAGVGKVDLPERILSGGMRRIIRRRVSRLNDKEREALRIAAIAGRSVDLALLAELMPDLDSEAWAQRCVEEAVLEYREQAYAFSYDKIRTYVIVEVDESEQRRLHRLLVDILVARDEDLRDYASVLAFHAAQAGERDLEARFSLAAARQNLEGGAFNEAVRFFKRAGELRDLGTPLVDAELPADAVVEAGLSECYYRMGNLAECTLFSGNTISAMSAQVPNGSAGMAWRSLSAMLFNGKQNDVYDPEKQEVSRAYLRLTDIYFYSLNQLGAVWSTLHAVKLARLGACIPEQAQAYALMGALTAAANFKGLGRRYARKSLLVSRETGDVRNRAWVATRLAVQSLSDCDWPKASTRASMARKLAERSGDLRLLEESGSLLAMVDMFTGGFARAAPQFSALRDLAERIDDRQITCWGAQGEAISLVRLGRSDEAREILLPTADLVHDPYMRIESINTHSILAVCELRSGEVGRAASYVEIALRLLDDTPPMAYWTQSGLGFLLEVVFALSEMRDTADYTKLRKRALVALDTFASSQRIGRPLQSLYGGLELQRDGKQRKAMATFAEGIERALACGMPYESALLEAAMMRGGAGDASAARVRAEFERMGCRYELAQLPGTSA
ncbi:MAG: AAA family ATPase [Pseudomonadota bacterium]